MTSIVPRMKSEDASAPKARSRGPNTWRACVDGRKSIFMANAFADVTTHPDSAMPPVRRAAL